MELKFDSATRMSHNSLTESLNAPKYFMIYFFQHTILNIQLFQWLLLDWLVNRKSQATCLHGNFKDSTSAGGFAGFFQTLIFNPTAHLRPFELLQQGCKTSCWWCVRRVLSCLQEYSTGLPYFAYLHCRCLHLKLMNKQSAHASKLQRAHFLKIWK